LYKGCPSSQAYPFWWYKKRTKFLWPIKVVTWRMTQVPDITIGNIKCRINVTMQELGVRFYSPRLPNSNDKLFSFSIEGTRYQPTQWPNDKEQTLSSHSKAILRRPTMLIIIAKKKELFKNNYCFFILQTFLRAFFLQQNTFLEWLLII